MNDETQTVDDFGILLPPNARIRALTFDDGHGFLRIGLADGGTERVAQRDQVRALHGARIRHEVILRGPKQKRDKDAIHFGASETTGRQGSRVVLPRGFSPRDAATQAEELHYALAMRVDGVRELWYLLAASFNFRQALADAATYSTDLNLRALVRRLADFAPQAVQDSFFTAVVKGFPLPPPLVSLKEFFEIVSR